MNERITTVTSLNSKGSNFFGREPKMLMRTQIYSYSKLKISKIDFPSINADFFCPEKRNSIKVLFSVLLSICYQFISMHSIGGKFNLASDDYSIFYTIHSRFINACKKSEIKSNSILIICHRLTLF